MLCDIDTQKCVKTFHKGTCAYFGQQNALCMFKADYIMITIYFSSTFLKPTVATKRLVAKTKLQQFFFLKVTRIMLPGST